LESNTTIVQKYKLEQDKIAIPPKYEVSIVHAIPNDYVQQQSVAIIIAHGAGGPMHSPFIRFFHTQLALHGYLSTKFNFPYMEAKRRLPDRTNILEETWRQVLDNVRSKFHPRKIFIGGKSMGGRIASNTAAKGADVDGLFFLGYPLHPIGKKDQLRDKHLYEIKKPMLFISGTKDNFADHDLLTNVVEKTSPNGHIEWIDDGDHSFKTPSKTGMSSWEGPLQILLDWLKRVS
jgi:predicted alpha/beta-hydrolase family hydrolase